MTDDAFGHWLAGFIDGEGCFGIYESNRHRGVDGYRFLFSITLRDDDEALIRELANQTGWGRIYRQAPRNGSKPGITWRIDRRSDLKALIALLDRCPLRSRKGEAYSVWREALLSIGRDWARVAAYAERLAAVKAYDRDDAELPELPEPPLALFRNPTAADGR